MQHTPVFPSLKLLTAHLHVTPTRTPHFPATWGGTLEPIVQTGAEDVFLSHTATFILGDAIEAKENERVVLRWRAPEEVMLSKEKFAELCYAQADYFNAQCLSADRGWRVYAFEMRQQVSADRIETQRYTIPLSFYETVAYGGKPPSFGIQVRM